MQKSLEEIVGKKYVQTGDDMAKWRVDWTKSYTADPMAVLRPANTDEVSRILALAYQTGTPVVPLGGNTGLTGGTSGTGMLMISLDRLNSILELDGSGRTITVEAGVILSKMQDAASRGGSVLLNSFEPFREWVSRSVMPPLGLVTTG